MTLITSGQLPAICIWDQLSYQMMHALVHWKSILGSNKTIQKYSEMTSPAVLVSSQMGPIPVSPGVSYCPPVAHCTSSPPMVRTTLFSGAEAVGCLALLVPLTVSKLICHACGRVYGVETFNVSSTVSMMIQPVDLHITPSVHSVQAYAAITK